MAKREFVKGVIVGAFWTVCIGVSIFLGARLGGRGELLSDRNFVNKVQMLEALVDRYYLEDADEAQMKEGMYTGLLYGLGDPYSRYYTAEEYAEETSATQGEYVGIGILMQKNEEGGLRIVECYEGGPGEKAGLLADDIIVSIDGTDVLEKSTKEAADMIRGRNGENVALTVLRGEKKEAVEITVPITDVELPSVSHEMLDKDTGYIRIMEFKGVTYQQYHSAFQDLENQGMKKLVVDLRGNPGGLLDSVCDILNDILPKGLIVYTEDKYGERSEERSDGENPLKIPLAVLVNDRSASASEIFAGAVQDYGIGTIVGTTTFGKGIVQSIRALPDGSAVKLTVSNYYTPNGNNIHKVGIRPDVEVKLNPELWDKKDVSHEEDNQLQAALQALAE